MKKRILCGILVACMAMTAAFAQKGAFRIQGHERPDLEDRLQPAVTAVAKAEQDNSFTFSDIKFWVGKGSKCAALVVDWHDEKLDHALVWGYRFDGEATGIDMVKAIAAADPRFVLLTHETNLGNTVAGLGFNRHLPYATQLVYAPKDADTLYYKPQEGVVTTDAYNYDDWLYSDTLALWKSGWYSNGYWSYQVKDRMPDEFTYSGSGASSRVLTDSCVDGWSFASLSGTTEGSLPRMPYEAVFSTVEPTEDNAYWGQMYKNAAHQSIVDFPLALAPNHFSVKWEYNFGGYSGQPIVVGDYLYNTTGKKICKISLADGSLMAEQQMVGSIGFFSMIAYGDGKIFVALGSGLMQAFDAVTLKPLWQSKVEVGGQQLCPIVYHDGYVYTGTWNGGSPATGVYYCLSTADDDPQAEDEIKTPVWQSANTGFYWSGGSIVGDCIFVGGDDGVMRSYNRRTGKIVDEWEVAPDVAGSTIRSGTSYDEKTGRLFFTGKEARKIYSVKIKADGTFDEASRLFTDIAGQATTTPTVYNGRVYATSGTMTSGGGLDVFNAETLEKIYSVDMGGISQSTPVVCTAFATEENKHEVYVYVCLNNAQGSIVCIKDFEGNTEPIVQYKWQAPKTQYCTHSLVVDQYGTTYYKNDSRGFWALSSQGILLSPLADSISIGEELALRPRIVSMGSNKDVSWVSTNPSVVTVDEEGVIKGIAVGEAKIVATLQDGGATDTCLVMVKKTETPVVTVTGVTLNLTEAELKVGGEPLQLTAMVMPENATNKNVSWLSTDTTVAKVSVSGAVTAIAPGQAKIVVKTEDGGFTDTCAVTVTKEPDFSFDDIKTWVGEGSKRAALVVDWNSDKKDHALVWGYRFDGEATGYDMLAAVAKADPRFVLLKEESIYGATIGGIAYNDHTPYQTRLLYNDSVYVPVDGVVTADSNNYGDWSCSDETALWQAEHWTVGYWSYYVKDRIEDDFGYAQTGISGRTLTDGSVDGLSFITSNPAVGGLPRMPYEFVEPCAPDTTRTEIAVTGVTLNKTEDSLYIGESLQLTAVVAPADATDKTCTWASSDESVASVSAAGLVKALKAGEAIITVTTVDGGFTATCRIKVTEKVGIDEHQPLAITVYPNPTASDFSLQTEEPVLMEVFTANGQRIISKQIATGTHTFKLERSGLYFVRVSTGNRSEVKRLVRL